MNQQDLKIQQLKRDDNIYFKTLQKKVYTIYIGNVINY